MFYSFSLANMPLQKSCIIKDVKKRFTLLENTENYSHIFIFHEPKIPMYGIALLRQAKLSDIISLEGILENDKVVWVLDNFSIKIENDNILDSIHHFDWHYENFLTSLYENLINFSINHSILDIFTHLSFEDHDDIKFFGKWPFNWEMGLSDKSILAHLKFDRMSYGHFKELWRNSTQPK